MLPDVLDRFLTRVWGPLRCPFHCAHERVIGLITQDSKKVIALFTLDKKGFVGRSTLHNFT